jgi:hypothetical protein
MIILRHPAASRVRVVVALTLAGAAGMVGLLAGASPAAAAGTVYAAVAAAGTGSCADPADACSLSTALSQVAAGGVVQLVTPASSARYVGNWTVSTPGTSAGAPVTIEPLPGLSSEPILDGGGFDPPPGTCSTASCSGPVLTVPAGEHVALAGITIADAYTTGPTGGGLSAAGTVTVTGATFTHNHGGDGGAIDSGNGYHGGGTGTVTVTGSTFTDNTGGSGGAIDSGSYGGGGSVTVTGSTFTGNTAADGGAIDSGDGCGSGGSVTVYASTFTGNTATAATGEFADGGAIDSGGFGGGGSVTVYASTFTGNTAKDDGGAIGSGIGGCPAEGLEGGGSVTVTASTFGSNTDASGGGGTIDNAEQGRVTAAADVFDGSCNQLGGTWDDQGYNAGSDASCFAAPAPATDVDAGSAAALALDPLASNGGPTQTVMPQPGSPVAGIIPDNTTVTLPGGQQFVCPVTDQRGYYTSPPGACDAGAVQTTGQAPVKLADSTPTPGFRQAGDQITYRYRVTNTDNTTLFGITVNDPAVPAAACPRSSLAPGKAETCTGSYTVTAADVQAGKVTETATATASTIGGNVVLSSPSTVTVRELWPASVTGSYQPPAGAAEGYYLGVSGSTWTLEVTHPGTGKVVFTGKITISAGTVTGLTPISLGTGDSTHVHGKTLTFTITSLGQVNGFRFTTKQAASITYTLKVNGKAATASQIYLGGTPTPSTSPSPLTFTR